MAVMVHLPSPLSGNLKIPPVDRYKKSPETRNLQKFSTEAGSTIPDQTKIQNQAEIRARVELATKNSSNLALRLQTLRHHLEFLKSKLGSTFADVYRDPPDPGPTRSRECDTSFRVKAVHEEQEESATQMPCEKMDLQVCRSSKLRHQEISYKTQEEPVKEEEIGVQNSPTILHQTKHSTLQPRCSTNCSEEADKVKLENVLDRKSVV